MGGLFDELADLPPADREPYLDRIDSPEVRRWVEQLLAAHDRPGEAFIDRAMDDVVEAMVREDSEMEFIPGDPVGREYGNWRATAEIGRGGMGVVLKGERADGRFEKDVAIKLLPPGPADTVRRERFLAEIRVLARLEHPNVAHLVDGGITDDGVPYLVMEYVDGDTIHEYCNRFGLDLKARVALVRQVVAAVGFIHRNLVVHADIKPANVLVTRAGLVKLVDFGVARVQGDSRDDTVAAGGHCSPSYAAPERLAGAVPSVTQDVFALGALLYLLLTGAPIRNARQRTTALLGRVVRDEIPLPSSRADSLFSPSRLRGDLDTICSRALSAEPVDRYASAEMLDADLHAWLDQRPVSARNGGGLYRTGKWLRRHWLPASAGLLAVLALLAGTSVSVWQARQATQARQIAEAELERATAMNDFVISLFQGARVGRPLPEVPATREILLRGVGTARERFGDQPGLRSEMLTVIGSLLTNVSLQAEARDVLAEAVSLREDIYPPDDPRLARSRLEYGRALHYTGEVDAGIENLGLAVNALRQTQDTRALADALHKYGFALSARSRFDEALAAHREAMALQRALADPDPRALGEGLAAMALTQQRAERLEASDETFRKALEYLRSAVGDNHHVLATTLSDHGVTLRRMGRSADAVAQLRKAVAIGRKVYDEPHVTFGQQLNNLGTALAQSGKRREAITVLEEAIEVLDSVSGSAHVLAGPYNNLGYLRIAVGEYTAAERSLQHARKLLAESVGPGHPFHIAVMRNIARAVFLQGRYDEAEAILGGLLERMRGNYPESDSRRIEILALLGRSQWEGERDEAGLERIRRARRLSLEHQGESHRETTQRTLDLADALRLVPDPERARELYRAALAVSVEAGSEQREHELRARAGLAESLLEAGRREEAVRALDALAALPPEDLARGDPLRRRFERLAASL